MRRSQRSSSSGESPKLRCQSQSESVVSPKDASGSVMLLVFVVAILSVCVPTVTPVSRSGNDADVGTVTA